MKRTRQIQLGAVRIGGGAPISIQSMCNTDTRDAAATLTQIRALAEAGCDIIRVAIPDERAADALKMICAESPIPVIADIHFDSFLAVRAMENGVCGLRINPGNLGGEVAIERVANAALKHQCVLRVGANSGSVSVPVLRASIADCGNDPKKGMTEALVRSVLSYVHAFEKYGVTQIKVSLKSTDVRETFDACMLFSQRSDYPQHIGITESGIPERGRIKSAVGLGALLLNGVGDTLRVSLTADPIEEVYAAREILQAAGLRANGPELVSCPTCGRTQINVQSLAHQVDELLKKNVNPAAQIKKIAVMGCAVNGPGEARDADLALCGTQNGDVLLIVGGHTMGLYAEADAIAYVARYLAEKR